MGLNLQSFLFVFCLCCTLNLAAMDDLLDTLESVANDPFNLKFHAAYIRLASRMQDDGEMVGDARSQMVSAVPATSGKPYGS